MEGLQPQTSVSIVMGAPSCPLLVSALPIFPPTLSRLVHWFGLSGEAPYPFQIISPDYTSCSPPGHWGSAVIRQHGALGLSLVWVWHSEFSWCYDLENTDCESTWLKEHEDQFVNYKCCLVGVWELIINLFLRVNAQPFYVKDVSKEKYHIFPSETPRPHYE